MKRIGVHSPPRSGSTWVGSIFDSNPSVIYKHQPLFSYAFKDRLDLSSTYNDIREFFHELANTSDEFLDRMEQKEEGKFPVFSKASPKAVVYKEVRYHHLLRHFLDTDSEIQIVGLIRNPIDTIYSWLNAPKEFDSSWDPLKQWRYAPKKNQEQLEEFNGYEMWKEVAWMFLDLRRKYPERFYLLLYERLNEEPGEVVKSLFEFCGLSWSAQTREFLRESTNTPSDAPYGVFRGPKKSYRHLDKIHPEIKESILTDPEFEALQRHYEWDI